MVVATKSVDALLKGLIKPDELMFSKIDAIAKFIQLDPSISSPKKDLFIISSDDMKNVKMRNDFVDALSKKHPLTLILYVNKTGKAVQGLEDNKFDRVIVKPTKQTMRDIIIELVTESERKREFQASQEIGEIDSFNPQFPDRIDVEDREGRLDHSKKKEESTPIDVPEDAKEDIEQTTTSSDGQTEFTLLERIKQAENWASIATIAKEVNASKIVQEIASTNAAFRQTETYITALEENITGILANPENTINDKLSKVRATLHDKAVISAQNNSIIEQSVNQIILALVDKSKEFIQQQTDEINERLLVAFSRRPSDEAPNVKLSTIIEDRSKLLLELQSLDLELHGVASKCISTINDTVDSVVDSSVATTGSPILDSQMKARFGDIVPDNLITVLDNLFTTGSEMSDEFNKMSGTVTSTVRKVYQLLALYREESEVLADTIRYLKANKVEDTVVANTILKKSTRLMITNGDFTSTALAYMISKYYSRKKENVLLLDLTDTPFLKHFGIRTNSYTKFLNDNLVDDKFTVVKFDSINDSIKFDQSNIERLLARLLHFSKHYSRINVICTSNQSHIFDAIKEDAISINYLVNCTPYDIRVMRDTISSCNVENTANRVILYNYINDSKRICMDLGVMDRLDIQLAVVSPINEIQYCMYTGQDPYDVESIYQQFVEVMKVC